MSKTLEVTSPPAATPAPRITTRLLVPVLEFQGQGNSQSLGYGSPWQSPSTSLGEALILVPFRFPFIIWSQPSDPSRSLFPIFRVQVFGYPKPLSPLPVVLSLKTVKLNMAFGNGVVWLALALSFFETPCHAGPLRARDDVPQGFYAPPYYPAPHGGWVASWRDSYAKAQKLVSQMTLAEKTNITAAVGIYMGKPRLPKPAESSEPLHPAELTIA